MIYALESQQLSNSDRQLGCEGKEKATPSERWARLLCLLPCQTVELFELATIRANQMYMRHGVNIRQIGTYLAAWLGELFVQLLIIYYILYVDNFT